ncbi:hypothetical protein SDC9_207290 [bioreactor metagenome]|uniref:Uncharacterized protein n=1 Tax=bioreactor metagenome TaxID=1076179 RepID=A0A645JA14_9ZZZZ
MRKNQNSNEISNITNPLSALQNPGDNMSARVTDSNRKVLKVETGNTKYSATQYPNGTIVETKTTKKK